MAKKKALKKWIFLAIFGIIIAAVVFVSTRGEGKGIEVTVKKVETGDITSVVTATGRVQPQVEVLISSEVPGEIIELAVKDGDRVQAGDLLVRVNPDTLEAQVKQQEAGLMATRASAAQRKAEMLQAELDLARVEDLFGKGFVTQDDLEQARTRLEVNKASHEAALHQVERQEMQLKEASDKLAKASIFSPISGTVVRLNSEIGDRVVGTGQFAGTEIMRVANLGDMEVRVEVSEADIVNVTIGQRAKIEIDAIPDQKFPGVVSEIANSARTTNERSQEQLTTFEVRIRLENPGETLRPGMTATADIETQTVTGVVKAPIGAVVVRPRNEVESALNPQKEDVKKDGKGDSAPSPAAEGRNSESNGAPGNREGRGGRENRVRIVFLEKNGKAILRKVETGIADRDFIEIKSGLEAGETIITGSYRALTRELKHESEVVEREAGKAERGGKES